MQILLELYHFEELTAIELAAMYGVTEVALRGRLQHRAKERLRAEMERLPGSPELVESTWTNLEEWAKQLRDGQGSDGEGARYEVALHWRAVTYGAGTRSRTACAGRRSE